ncbi:MAG: hypothetical protein KAS04_02925 [Candidatus Aenigmarchaeota archaeon]|nr:hypothetical protein [Candidatus Aenigmarchaeota archaeon]
MSKRESERDSVIKGGFEVYNALALNNDLTCEHKCGLQTKKIKIDDGNKPLIINSYYSEIICFGNYVGPLVKAIQIYDTLRKAQDNCPLRNLSNE